MGNKSSHRKICATLKEPAISLSHKCSCLCANVIFAVMGCHPWMPKSLRHPNALIYPKNSARSSVTNLWSMRYLPGQLTPPSPHGLLLMVRWDSTVCHRHPACSQPHLSHLWSSGKTWPSVPPELAVWLVAHLTLKAPDRGYLGF